MHSVFDLKFTVHFKFLNKNFQDVLHTTSCVCNTVTYLLQVLHGPLIADQSTKIYQFG